MIKKPATINWLGEKLIVDERYHEKIYTRQTVDIGNVENSLYEITLSTFSDILKSLYFDACQRYSVEPANFDKVTMTFEFESDYAWDYSDSTSRHICIIFSTYVLESDAQFLARQERLSHQKKNKAKIRKEEAEKAAAEKLERWNTYVELKKEFEND